MFGYIQTLYRNAKRRVVDLMSIIIVVFFSTVIYRVRVITDPIYNYTRSTALSLIYRVDRAIARLIPTVTDTIDHIRFIITPVSYPSSQTRSMNNFMNAGWTVETSL
jgi:hypothetical protein